MNKTKRVDGYPAAKLEAELFRPTAETWLRAVSKAIFDITKDASVTVGTLKQNNMEHGIVYRYVVCTPTRGIDHGAAWLFRALPSQMQRSAPTYTRPWLVRAITFRAFLGRIVRQLQDIGLTFDVKTFRAVVALYLFDLND